MKFNIHLRSTFKLWNRNVETYKFMSTFESASEEIVCTPWMSLFVWACLSDATGEKSKWLWPEYVSRLCVADICYGHANVQTYTYFLYFFCAQKSRLYKYFELVSSSINPYSTKIFHAILKRDFYNVWYLPQKLHQYCTLTHISQTKPWTEKTDPDIVYICKSNHHKPAACCSAPSVYAPWKKCLNKCFFNDEFVKWKEQAKKYMATHIHNYYKRQHSEKHSLPLK